MTGATRARRRVGSCPVIPEKRNTNVLDARIVPTVRIVPDGLIIKYRNIEKIVCASKYWIQKKAGNLAAPGHICGVRLDATCQEILRNPDQNGHLYR